MESNSQDLLLAEIAEAFSGVRLGDGISWREAIVLDDYGSDQERKQARMQDEREDWTKIPLELIGDLRYQSALSFLDTAGLIYYLPICMIYFLEKGEESDSAIIDSLISTLTDERTIIALTKELNKRQRACVQSFLFWDLKDRGYFPERENIKQRIHGYGSEE